MPPDASTPDSLRQLAEELTLRWQRGEAVRVEYFVAQHPTLTSHPSALIELIRAEWDARLHRGEIPTLDEYRARFPGLATELVACLNGDASTGLEDKAEKQTFERTTKDGQRRAYVAEVPRRPLALPGLELIEKIGQGGMGVVWRARDTRLEQPRAIKLIRPGQIGDTQRERFHREAKAIARLDHPGVVRIHAISEFEETLYLCMEFVSGGNLSECLASGPMEVRRAAELVWKLALAVQHAHEQRVLHRDLKPGNVLLTAEGDPKVADFGLAKLLDADEELTFTGAVMGTPSYMAPEQAEGRQRGVGEWTDVWGLGTILYECLAGRPAFKGDGRQDTLELVKRSSPVALRRLRDEIPADLEAICLKCLQKSPARRYASAGELAADVRDWLDGNPVRAYHPNRRRFLVGVASAIVGVGTVALALQSPSEQPSPVVGFNPQADIWNPVLTREPGALRWPTPGTNSHRVFDPAGKSLLATCEDLGLLTVGETEARQFKIAVTLRQNPWSGNVGLFFGYRESTPNGVPVAECHLLELTANRGDGIREYAFEWTHQLWQDAAARPFERRDRKLGSGPFPLGLTESRVELNVGPGGIESVALDGKPVEGLHFGRLALPLSPGSCAGRFGFYLRNSSAQFRDAEFYFSKDDS